MYLSLAQIADSLGVTEKVAEGWVRLEGMPHTRDAGRLLFDRAQVADWAAKRGLAARAGFLAPTAAAAVRGAGMGVLLRAGGIWRDVRAAGVTDVFVRVATSLPGATPPVREMLAQRLRAEGGVSLAPIGDGLALPHPSARITLGRDSGAMALILLQDALPTPAVKVDDVPIRTLVFFIAPSPRVHLDLIGRIAHLLARGPLHEALARGATDAEILEAVDAADQASPRAPGPEAP